MLKFDFENMMAERVGAKDGLTSKDLAELDALAPGAHKKFKDWRGTKDAIFYDVIFDAHLLDGIDRKAEEVASTFENVVVLGIGGSALGARAATQALLPPFWNLMGRKDRGNFPRLFICDNIDPETFEGLLKIARPQETCFIVVSKSGKTTETAAQFFIVLQKLQQELSDSWKKHIVIITDPEAGELRPFVKEHNLDSFAIPPKLGGRFSVLSPVGMFPAACVGIDIKAMLSGAQDMAKRASGKTISENVAYQIGGYNYLLDTRKNKAISAMMPYSDALSLMADWYIQLWAESLGKAGKGQTPLKALGPTDQHSQVQLFMEGPNNKVFTFVGTDEFRSRPDSTRISECIGSFDYLVGHNLGNILNAERHATTEALTKMSRPNMTITFPKIDARHIGEFFMTYEIATAFAGALYNVNPFDQPGVELGKTLTKERLLKKP